MTSPEPVPENVQLRYGSTQVFAQADVQSVSLRVLTAGDAFTVLGTEGDFYKVALPDGVTGFVYAHNLTGTHMPLTRREQEAADERAAEAARPEGGWRGLLQRLRGPRRVAPK